MIKPGYLLNLPSILKSVVLIFLLVLSFGFTAGLKFVHFTTDMNVSGVEENYIGNENNPESDIMKFRKSEYEILNLIHTHILAMSLIFFVLAILVFGIDLNEHLKKFLMIEPLLSVLTTFGGIYLVWNHFAWASYLVIISGSLMTISYFISVGLITKALVKRIQ
jgi:hypothetical protein